MPPLIVDTHCHLDVEEFDPDRAEVLDRAHAQGVQQIIVPAIHAAAWQRVVDCRNTWPKRLEYALGLHPVYLAQHEDRHLQELEARIACDRPVAVGEIGLDYFVKDLDRQAQQALFEAQLDIAVHARLPVILHVRKAHDQVLQCLKGRPVVGGIVHAFNASLPQAARYLAMGFKLGFGGMITYERSTKLRTLAKELPLDGIVLETDAPDLTVARYRGQRNSPEYLPECLAALAEVRGVEPVIIAEQTTRNARDVLNLGE